MYHSLENNLSENLSISALLHVQYYQLHTNRECHKAMLETFHENVLFATKILHFLEH